MRYNQLNNDDIRKIIDKNLGQDWKIHKIFTKNNSSYVTLSDPCGYMYSDVYIQSIKNNKIPQKFRKTNNYVIHNINHWCELNNKNFRLNEGATYVKSNENIEWRCLECGNIFLKRFNDVKNHQNFACPSCDDGNSYPQKFIKELLKQLKESYVSEFKPKWSHNKRYDFYLYDKKEIWEANGSQHYNENGFNSFGGKTLKEEQENDKLKEKLALQNGIKKDNYIVIDCRKSELEWIKNSILQSKIAEIFDLSKIDWLKCHEYACSSYVKTTCELWNSGIKSTSEISKVIGVHYSTIVKYLKQGANLNWCNYTANKKEIIQFDLKGSFIKNWDSIIEAENILKINNISACCNGKQKSSGGYMWQYKNLYNKNNKNINPYKRGRKMQKVVQLNLNNTYIKEWESIVSVTKELGLNNTSIINCCKNKSSYKTVGGFKWLYYNDYLNQYLIHN